MLVLEQVLLVLVLVLLVLLLVYMPLYSPPFIQKCGTSIASDGISFDISLQLYIIKL